MAVAVHEASEVLSLRELIRTESNAKQRDRFRAVLLAIEGESGVELEGDQIAVRLGRSPRFVDQWLVPDGAGWHVAKALQVPENITLLHLPPYSPKLNPVERVWAFLRSHYLSKRVFKSYEELFEAAKTAWNSLDEARLKSICHTAWTERAV